jgi:hypothetical protein
MVPQLNTPSVVSLPAQQANHIRPELELSLGNFNINGGSIGCSADGVKFAFTIWPLPDATAAALEGVAATHGRICLYCCDQPLLFDLVELQRKEPGKVRLVGRLVGRSFDAPRNTGQVRL